MEEGAGTTKTERKHFAIIFSFDLLKKIGCVKCQLARRSSYLNFDVIPQAHGP
jgi:hypothetical protein